MPISNSSATWQGGLKGGKGTFQAGSGLFSGDYSFPTRFEGAKGTNPEELIAAAHAACFSMALAAGLEKAGKTPERISTTAAASLDKVGDGFKITRIKLVVRGKVPGLDQAGFTQAAQAAKDGCPVSGALKGNVQMELEATLEG
ncbi:MAG: OsmC family protein [Gemmatimonadales bacterium]